jgi:hypothetical protein
MRTRLAATLLLILYECINLPSAVCQSLPVATQTLLEGVKSRESQAVIKSVLMIKCQKDGWKGTGFMVSGAGVITTNAHVVGSCSAMELSGVSSVSNEEVKFSAMEKDTNRDLALLCPVKPLPFGLTLTGDGNPPVDTEVETWGYPLQYNDVAPILSRGYVAGYTLGKDAQGRPKQTPVKHLIVNGAINPGNSGGPLIDKSSGNVIGIVVEKWTMFSPLIKTTIQTLGTGSFLSSGLIVTDAQGKQRSISQQELIAASLKELYNKSQMMIGEAISVSELNTFITEKKASLACGSK